MTLRKSVGFGIFPSEEGANDIWLSVCLLLVVFITYQPVWYAGFIWDDDNHLTANPCIVGPLGLKEIWTTSAASICPLVLTTFWVENAMWGLSPLPYHLVNVLQFGLSAVVLWRVLLRLQVPGAWLGAALWALHPVQVESTAWVSEMKNTQSGLFYLLSILFFLKYLKVANREERGTTSWNYTFTLLFAALAMASKFSTSILPAVMVLVAWWHQGQWRWRNLLLLAPIFAMSFIASVAAIWPHPSPFGTFQGFHDTRGWSERLAMAGDVIWFYLGKLIWPYPLMAIYPRWSIDASSVTSYLPLSAAIAVSVALWLKRNSQARPFFFAWSYFIVAVSPFLTLIDQTFWVFSFVEDHLQYLASMGPLALIGAGLARIAEKNIFRRWHIGSIVTVIILLTLGALSWQRSWAFESVKANFLDTLSKNPKCWLAYNDVGFSLVAEGNFSDAIADFDKAIALNPRYADAYANLGVALALQGRYEESIVRFERALEIQPKFASAHNNLGASLEHQGRLDEAISQYKEAINENPYYQQAQDNLSRTEIEYALRQRPR